ncbi:TPA: dihydropteroate synthase [Candidatus Poribacteria bacterium]|jgi:dihydropteroate synthase|nr:dihydropteroate synthase [Candidatus Poribacteria bacterium]HIA66021.1 dihydropteroate synthase [Candidatus Poribacteria bacterium]HIB91889.1 dihydropteroate synthase [Candidatus Poribacteria bacterium]HIC00165.1 dihydropteroate synthase [Candidatus Poribacteria bacterium]HIM09485.1 dihydropteroate synthase [Candidatus Poribacteria bacterium]
MTPKQVVLGKRTLIMGILNVTPDSFSDGGRFASTQHAVKNAKKMVDDGADIIDIGGESSRPGADPVSVDEELERVIPVVRGVTDETEAIISVDTCKAAVADQALQAGADMINDITALRFDPDIVHVVAEANASIILMHMQGNPRTMQQTPAYTNLIDEVSLFLQESIEFAESNGVAPGRIFIDPGIGFGKTVQHNLEILRQLDQFKRLGKPMLIGTSRKSFIGKILDLPVECRLEGTAATVAWSIAGGVDIVRVHDVKPMKRVAKMTDAIYRY